MSIGGNPSLIIDTLVNTSALPAGMAQAEAIVGTSTANIGRKVDGVMGTIGNQITGKLKAALGAGMAIGVVDSALRSMADAIRNDRSVANALSDGIMDGIKRIPIVGAIVDLAQPAAESFGEAFAMAWMQTYDAETLDRITFSAKGNEDLIEQERRRREALEQELSALQETRGRQGDPIAQAMGSLRGAAMMESSTALGAFRFGIGSAADISRGIYEEAQTQVAILERIEEIQKELRDSIKGSN